MDHLIATQTLSVRGALAMIDAAMEKAAETGQPQCIVVVDASGETIASARMDGAKFLSMRSARSKARTAASTRAPSHAIPDAMKPLIAMATETQMTGLPGGLPIITGGQCIGGIGIGSGTGEQDVEVAKAALAAIGADIG